MACAQGSGSAGLWIVVLCVVAAMHCSTSLAASAIAYTVGDAKGWNVGINYTAWAEGKTFSKGDILFFPYTKGNHDVLEVTKAGYDGCSSSSANTITTENGGNTNVTLTAAGAHYFLCSFPTHCTSGMKLAVTVVNATASPTPSSSPANSSSNSSSPGSYAALPVRFSAPSFTVALLLVAISGALLAF